MCCTFKFSFLDRTIYLYEIHCNIVFIVKEKRYRRHRLRNKLPHTKMVDKFLYRAYKLQYFSVVDTSKKKKIGGITAMSLTILINSFIYLNSPKKNTFFDLHIIKLCMPRSKDITIRSLH